MHLLLISNIKHSYLQSCNAAYLEVTTPVYSGVQNPPVNTIGSDRLCRNSIPYTQQCVGMKHMPFILLPYIILSLLCVITLTGVILLGAI